MGGAAAVIEKYKLDIIENWVKNVREELEAPNETTDPVLRDHLPLLLDDYVKIMKRFERNEITSLINSYDGMLDTSIGHGRHRSSSLGYDVEQVLKEYIILHRIMTKVLRSENVFSSEIGDLLKYMIENSMLYAVVAFNNSLQEIRQKLIGVLAHDIRNPASAAYLGLQMIRQDDSPEKFERIKNMSRNSIKRTIDLLEELLESVNVEPGEGITLHFSERDLVPYIKSLYGEALEIYSNDFILECEYEKILGVFDTAMIRRILENIVNNAVKYGGRDTPVTISVDDLPDEVVIKIHNNGNPISEKDQKEIFEFLATSNGISPGKIKSWGMGLTLVNAVAKAHGGHLDLQSNEDQGTTFKLVLNKKENEPGKVKVFVNFDKEATDISD